MPDPLRHAEEILLPDEYMPHVLEGDQIRTTVVTFTHNEPPVVIRVQWQQNGQPDVPAQPFRVWVNGEEMYFLSGRAQAYIMDITEGTYDISQVPPGQELHRL